jgi:acylphosphatase
LQQPGRLWLISGGKAGARYSFSEFSRAGVISTDMSRERLQIIYAGRVQGVGFRYSAKALATGFDVTGTVRNLPDGRVELVIEGTRAELEEFRNAVHSSELGGLIRQEEISWSNAKNEFRGFEIIR